MKELEKSKIYKGKELEELLAQTLGEIKALIQKNKYQISNSKNLEAYFKYNYKKDIGNASYKTIKRLNRQILYWTRHQNIGGANRFFHFLRTKLTVKREEKKSDWGYGSWFKLTPILEPVKLRPSIKEEIIQDKRREWKKLRDKAEKALLAYKEEKGDFYKNQMKEKVSRKLEMA